MNKTLIVYFSASGTTKSIAEEISNMINTDLYEIKPQEKYTSDDLNWMNKESRSSLEMKNLSSRPEIIKEELELSKYDKIVLAFPIWWGIAPTIVNTFLENHNFSGKTIYPIATSGGSGYGDANKLLKNSLGENIILKDGKIVNSVTNEIIEWLTS